jgi:hypothetical protein
MLTPEQASNAKKLMAEALELANEVKANRGKLAQDGVDALELIKSQQEAAKALGTLEIYGRILQSNGDFAKRMMRLLDMSGNIRREGKDTHYPEEAGNVINEIKEVDPAKIEDEDLLRELERRRDNVFEVDQVISLCVASAQIPISFLVFAHSDLMLAYVGKPPLSRRALDNASQLGAAVVMDLSGTFFPLFGTALTASKLMEPWLEREKARTAKAVPLVDRIFNLDRGLTNLEEFGALVERSVSQASEFLSTYRKAFDDDVSWLIQTARAARKV